MAGVTVFLVIIGVVAYLGQMEPTDIVVIIFMALSVLAAMYLGYRLGNRFS